MAMIGLFRRYWRRVGVGLLLGWALLPLAEGWAGLPDVAIQLLFLASQMFWIRRIGALAKKLVTGRRWRVGLGASGLLIYSVLLAYNIRNWENVSQGSTLSLRAALLAVRTMRNAVEWCIVAGREPSIDAARAKGAVLIEQNA